MSAHFIYDYALQLIDREGIDALTLRRLAAELEISVRTLRTRISSRDRLIRELIDLNSTRLNLDIQPFGTLGEMIWVWCLQLHQCSPPDPT